MNDDIICGINAVRALFQRRPQEVQRLFYTAPLRAMAGPLCAQLAERRQPYRELAPEEMQKAAGTTHHGGIAAVAKPREIAFLDIDKPPQAALLLVVDQVANPFNLGAIARSAAFFGVTALLLHDTRLAAMPPWCVVPAAFCISPGRSSRYGSRRSASCAHSGPASARSGAV